MEMPCGLILAFLLLTSLLQNVEGVRTKNKLSGISIKEATDWIYAWVEDLEFADLAETPRDPDPKHDIRKKKFVESLIESATIDVDLKYEQLFEFHQKLFDINTRPGFKPRLLVRDVLHYNDLCVPEDHFTLSPLEIMKHNPKKYFAEVQKWHDRVGTDPKICDTYLGLICNEGTKKCDCPPGTVWDDKGGISDFSKCYITPDRNCTLKDIDAPNSFEQVTEPEFLDQIARLLIHPVLLPICGRGLYCYSFNLEENETPTCWCLKRDSRPECKNVKKTFEEFEPYVNKLIGLFIPLGDPCTPPDAELKVLLDQMMDPHYRDKWVTIIPEIVEKGIEICKFLTRETCSPTSHVCVQHCLVEGQVRDEDGSCRFNNAENCDVTTPNINECVDLAKCREYQDFDRVPAKNVSICVCLPTEETQTENFLHKEYHFGEKCSSSPRAFFLQLLKPVICGLESRDYVQAEIEIHNALGPLEKIMTKGKGDSCDPDLVPDPMDIVNYFGNLQDPKNKLNDQKEYKAVLQKAKILVDAGVQLCNYRKFLKCSKKSSSCELIDDRVIVIQPTLPKATVELRLEDGEICGEYVPPEIPFIYYYKNIEDNYNPDSAPGINDGIPCVDNSYCVVDLRFDIEEITDIRGRKRQRRHCRCARGFKGSTCKEKVKLDDYLAKEFILLIELIKLRKERSTYQYGELCHLHIEEKFPKRIDFDTLNTTDLYQLLWSLDEMITSVIPLQAKEGLQLCDPEDYLRCYSVPFHPLEITSKSAPICDCLEGYERVERDGRVGCLLSDGEECGPTREKKNRAMRMSNAPLVSLSDLGCASESCVRDPVDNVYRCEEDQSFKYFVKFKGNANHVQSLKFLTTFLIFLLTLV